MTLCFLLSALCFICVFVHEVESFETRESELEFIESVLEKSTKYSPHPLMLNNTVFIHMALYQILSINEKEGTVNTKLWSVIAYYLPHLRWQPLSQGAPELLTLPKGSFWSPNLNLKDATEILYSSNDSQYVHYDGLVIIESKSLNIKFSCTLKLRRFPFDQQV